MNNKAHLRPKDFDSNGDIIPMGWKEERTKGDLISRAGTRKERDRHMEIVSEYVRDRDSATIAVVEGESIEVFKTFVRKWQDIGIYPPCFGLPTDGVLEVCIRQMALHEENIPEQTKQKARKWLLARGYKLNYFN